MKLDAWQNVVTKLGTVYDRLTYTEIADEAWKTEPELEALFYGDWICERIISEPVDAAFRNGWKISPPGEMDPDEKNRQTDLVQKQLEQISAEENLVKALYWGRLYGRGALMLGAKDGVTDLRMPLAAERVTDLTYVEDLSVDEFVAKEYQQDPSLPRYGEPEVWTVTRSGATSTRSVDVHSSRLILTGSRPTSRKKRNENEWRDAPVLQSVYESVRNYSNSMLSVAHMLSDASQAVLSINGLLSAMAEHGTEAFETRMRILDLARALRIMPLDAGDSVNPAEKFEYVERTFAGIADVLDRIASDVAGAAGMPQTVLFGRSPAGMNATGESDTRGWYDRVEAQRSKIYRPALAQVVQLAAQAVGASDPLSWDVEFNGLWLETDSEKKDREKTTAETDKINIDSGVYTEDEVAIQRYGGDEYDDSPIRLSRESVEARETLLGMDLDRATGEPQVGGVEGQVDIAPDIDEAVPPSSALNGAQVKSMMDIVLAVANRQIPRQTGVSMMSAAFPINEAQAAAIMGAVGESFFIENMAERGAGLTPDQPTIGGEGEGDEDGDQDDPEA